MIPFLVNAQNVGISPSTISTPVYFDLSAPLSEMADLPLGFDTGKDKRNEEMKERLYPFASIALPQGNDAVWQDRMGRTIIQHNRALEQNFAGQSSYSDPPDCNGTVGPNHYMQTINVTYAIYDKTGTLLVAPTNMNTLFSGVPGANENDGDPIIMYDEQADRWLAAEFSGVSSDPVISQ